MSSHPVALITGASTGIGLACVERLDQRGWRVVAGVRSPADAARLDAMPSGRVRAVQLDVTSPTDIAAVRQTLEDMLGERGLDLLVNNAGIVTAGPLEFLPIDAFRQVQEVNVVGLLAVTQACLPLLRRARGRIINMGSVSGRVANPFIGAYAASKHALEGLNDSLRLELAPFGIHVILIQPGMIRTPIWSKSEAAAEALQSGVSPEAGVLYGDAMEAIRRVLMPAVARAAPVELVADVVEEAVWASRPRARYVVGRSARLRLMLGTILPDRLRDWLTLSVLRRAGTGTP